MRLGAYEGPGQLTLQNSDGVTVEVMNAIIPLSTFRLSARLDASGDAAELATMSGSTTCAEVPFYGQFLQMLGLCNPQTDVLTVFGAAILRGYNGGSQQAPTGIGNVAFSVSSSGVSATLSNSALRLDEHVLSLLLVDDTTGLPITLDYGLDTARSENADHTVASVSVPIDVASLPAAVRAYLMVDTYPAARAVLTP